MEWKEKTKLRLSKDELKAKETISCTQEIG